MAPIRFFATITMFLSAGVVAAPPQMYRDATHESPARGAPDDLLLLAGYGFDAGDTVVYRAIRDPAERDTEPQQIPPTSNAEFGVASIVSSADIPYSLTIKLPQVMHADQTYAFWVRTSGGEWSRSVVINDARPLWFSPAVAYASGSFASLPRELKIVGRNLQPSAGRSTRVALIGPQRFTGPAISDPRSRTMNEYVVRVLLPTYLAPGHYRVMVNRDGFNWVEIKGQALEILADAPTLAEFSVSDPQFGGCRPDDGLDDSECIVRAVAAAARAGGGIVHFEAGTWDLIDGNQPGMNGGEGIVVPAGVQLRGAGNLLTRVRRHAQWSARAATAAFTLVGHTQVTGFTFQDLQVYQPDDPAGPYLQLGVNWRRSAMGPNAPEPALVSQVVITHNVFDKPWAAIGSGGLPVNELFITYNTFGAYHAALELGGDQYNMMEKYQLDDSVIDYNMFSPGSELNVARKTGSLASELGAGLRVDFSANTADGTSADYLYTPQDAKGWRAGFFWSTNNSVEEVLVSHNTATCTGDKIGDGEAIAFDSNLNTFAFSSVPTVVDAALGSVTVSVSPAARQNGLDVAANYYVGHWVQVVSGPGLGQVRKIVGYSTDAVTRSTTFRVSPDWDVMPAPRSTRISIGREYWQLYVLDNHVDNRLPLCQKSNRSRRVGGAIELWAQTADTVVAGNRQDDSDGIFVQQNYGFLDRNSTAVENPCADCTMFGFFNFFLEIRDNLVDGEYDWANDCSRSGIALGVAAAPWAGDGAPPTVGFGISVAHNSVRRADGQFGGAIAQVNTWFNGPKPNHWPLSDNLLIHHNSIAEIDGPRALAICGASRPRIGVAFPDPAIAWRTVLYANSCTRVSTPIGPGGVDTVKVCPSSGPDSCECPQVRP